MDIKKITKELDKFDFHKHITYPFIPVVYIEYACMAYHNNPYRKYINQFSNSISILNTSFESWQDYPDKYLIKEKSLAEKIIADCRRIMLKNTPYLKKIW